MKKYLEYKDSGIKWLGKIPKHWKNVWFKHYIDFQEGPGILAVDFVKKGVPLLRIVNIQKPYVDLKGCNFLTEEKVKKKWQHFRLKAKDLLISCSATTGIISEVTQAAAGSIPYTGIIRLRPGNELINRLFIKWIIASKFYLIQIDLMKTGSTIQHYGPLHLKQILFPLPPIEEQEKIAAFLDYKTALSDTQIAKIQKQIQLLKEYRTTLISQVVTGKIDIT